MSGIGALRRTPFDQRGPRRHGQDAFQREPRAGKQRGPFLARSFAARGQRHHLDVDVEQEVAPGSLVDDAFDDQDSAPGGAVRLMFRRIAIPSASDQSCKTIISR